MKRWFFQFALPTKKALDQIVWSYRSHYHGSGAEFSTIREYAFGDDAKHIDPRTSAKAGKAFVRLFQEDKAASFLFCFDAGSTMRHAPYADASRTKYSKALEVFEYLAYSAIESKDRIGAILYGSQPSIIELPSASSENAAYRLVESVRSVHASESRPCTPGELRDLVSHLSDQGTKRRSICIFTDQPLNESTDSSVLDGLGALALRNDITVCFLADAWETGQSCSGAVWSGTDGVSVAITPESTAAYAAKYAEWSQGIRSALASRNIRSFHCVVGNDTASELLAFLHTAR